MRTLILFTLLLVVACSEQETSTPRQSSKLTQVSKLEIRIDSTTQFVPISVESKRIDPDSVNQPQKEPFPSKPFVKKAPSNIVPLPPARVLPISKTPMVITPGEDGVPLPQIDTLENYVTPVKHKVPLASGSFGVGTSGKFDFRQLPPKLGLSSASVNDMMEDRRGHIWLATEGDGLLHFDGNSFSQISESEGMNTNDFFNLFEDKDGNIWIGGRGGMLSRYDGKDLTHFRSTDNTYSPSVPILKDSRGYFWAGHAFGYLHRNDIERKQKVIFNFPELNYAGSPFSEILEDKKGNLWMVNSRGIYRYNPNVGAYGSFEVYAAKEGWTLGATSVLQDRQGNIWFAGYGGIVKYDGSVFSQFLGESNTQIMSLYEDRQGNIWFCEVEKGLYKYDGENLFLYSTENGLPANQVKAILQDSEGYMWLAHAPKGLSRFDPNGFTHFTEQDGLRQPYVWAITEDKAGHLWLNSSTWNNLGGFGISRFEENENSDGGQFFHYGLKEGFYNNWIQYLLTDSKGNIWATSSVRGISRHSPTENTVTYFTQKEGLARDFGWTILEDSKGDFWFGGWLLNHYDGQAFTHYDAGVIISSYEDRKGIIWFGTWQEGLLRYDPQKKEGKKFTQFQVGEGMLSNSVESIYEDAAGNIWFGKGSGGLGIYDGEQVYYITGGDQGFFDRAVHSILADRDSNIWVTTLGGGIGLFTPLKEAFEFRNDSPLQNYQFRVFNKSDGLKGLGFQIQSGLHDSKNRMWWGSTEGMTMLDLNQFSIPSDPPKSVSLSHIEINQQFVDYQQLSDTAYRERFTFGKAIGKAFDSTASFYNYPLDLELPYYLDHLTFHFSAVDWNAPHKIQYSYKIEGIDQDWSLPSKEPRADYRNLPHGAFVLKVKAIGEAQVWSEPFTYAFTIRPPWWQTWWAYSIYALLLMAAVWGYTRWRTRNLLKRQEELEQTVTERTAEVVAQKEVIEKEKDRSEALLLNILPAEVAEELKSNGSSPAKDFEQVTVLFTDFKHFTQISEQLSAKELVEELNTCFKAFDEIITKYGVEKIKTIGDAYMAAGGLHLPRRSEPKDVVLAALEMQQFMKEQQQVRAAENQAFFEMRCGIHTGPVVAGIVGVKKFQYDIWGDTVNMAARMESSGTVGEVNLSQTTYELVKANKDLNFTARGKVKAKNKGEVEMYFVKQYE
ncbi:MAG: adenylate/guanylate cyclase domain-containing protein [Bacteroidota bacterium]